MEDTNFLESISTKDLVKELLEREGVEHSIIQPYSILELKVEGPAVVITVID